MSSVEQKIREVIAMAKDYHMAGTSKGYSGMTIDEATQSILQIIESDVIGGDENPEGEPPYATISGYRADIEIVVAQSQNTLRAKQRANLREDK